MKIQFARWCTRFVCKRIAHLFSKHSAVFSSSKTRDLKQARALKRPQRPQHYYDSAAAAAATAAARLRPVLPIRPGCHSPVRERLNYPFLGLTALRQLAAIWHLSRNLASPCSFSGERPPGPQQILYVREALVVSNPPHKRRCLEKLTGAPCCPRPNSATTRISPLPTQVARLRGWRRVGTLNLVWDELHLPYSLRRKLRRDARQANWTRNWSVPTFSSLGS